MKINKFLLLTATAAAACGTAAQAQVALNPATIYGNGASLPANAVRQIFDCIGDNEPLYFRGVAAAVSVFDFNYAGTGTAANPAFNCATRTVQPGLKAVYVSTGSGRGVTAWREYNLTQVNTNPFGPLPSIQYGMSETPLSTVDIQLYNANVGTTITNPDGTTFAAAAQGAAPKKTTGAPIQVPFNVAIVGLTYDPVYAKERNGGGFINEYRFTVGAARTDGSGGVRLTKNQYCGIINGTITNWNQLPTSVINRDVNDAAPFSVPIILVGRSETSGTSSVFTRAIAAQCDGRTVAVGVNGTGAPVPIVNKFTNSENRLPYDGSVQVTTTQLAGSAYNGTGSSINPTNSISGAYFTKGATPTLTGTPTNNGLFLIADGSDGVAQAVDFHPDPSATPGTRTLNGKFGYVGPDYTLPAVLFTGQNNYGLNTASLQEKTSATTYSAPIAAEGTQAFGTGPTAVLPPESTPTGVYRRADQTGTSGGNRANPLDWVLPGNKFLVDTTTGVATTTPNRLADPAVGYPIVGTTNVLLYTCYASNDVREAVNEFFTAHYGKVTKDSTGTTTASNVPVGLFTSATLSVLARSGLAPVPTSFRTAIVETFLKKSTQASPAGAANQLGLRNLWIQNRQPLNATTGRATLPNPTCTSGQGA